MQFAQFYTFESAWRIHYRANPFTGHCTYWHSFPNADVGPHIHHVTAAPFSVVDVTTNHLHWAIQQYNRVLHSETDIFATGIHYCHSLDERTTCRPCCCRCKAVHKQRKSFQYASTYILNNPQDDNEPAQYLLLRLAVNLTQVCLVRLLQCSLWNQWEWLRILCLWIQVFVIMTEIYQQCSLIGYYPIPVD